jgi:hypothetical protein
MSSPYSDDRIGRHYDELIWSFLLLLFFLMFTWSSVCSCALLMLLFISVRLCTSDNCRLRSMVVTLIEVKAITALSL